jgi:hypothetical protein
MKTKVQRVGACSLEVRPGSRFARSISLKANSLIALVKDCARRVVRDTRLQKNLRPGLSAELIDGPSPHVHGLYSRNNQKYGEHGETHSLKYIGEYETRECEIHILPSLRDLPFRFRSAWRG